MGANCALKDNEEFLKGEIILYFQTRILFVSFLATVIISIFVIPILKKLKVGQIERDDGPQSHYKKQGTPTMGGIIIIFTYYVLIKKCLIIGKVYLIMSENIN